MSIEHVLYDHNIKNGGSVRSVNGRHGNVTITAAEIGAAPAVHKHEISDVTGLQPSLELLDTTKELLTDMNRKSVSLAEGTHIVTSETSALVDVEIEGRTLTSMANSNLEGGKYYVVADPKTKVGVDKKVVGGVGKFQKAQTLRTVATFTGKIKENFSSNPHISYIPLRAPVAGVLQSPTNNWFEGTDSHYELLSNEGPGITAGSGSLAGSHGQMMFSVDVVSQIERELGIIPRETRVQKALWVRDNIWKFNSKWTGYAKSSSSVKSSFAMWNETSGSWTGTVNHSYLSAAALTKGQDAVAFPLDAKLVGSDGFLHYLAYAEATDGSVNSVIYSDYFELAIELKPTAQLNTRGNIIRVENFEGKVAGSTVENPHSAISNVTSPTHLIPGSISGIGNFGPASYNAISKADGSVIPGPTTATNTSAQHLFSFDIIEAVERNIGKIPAKDVSEKVSWLKLNVEMISPSWYGFGRGPGGPKSTFLTYTTNSWFNAGGSHTSGTPSKLTANHSTVIIQPDGFVHFLAHAEPSDGVTPSTINTDYIELEIKLKPDANFHAPKVPLYEVTKPEYDKIGIAWDENEVRRRYPVVEGTQHLVNPYVMAEGDNLIPSFYEAENVNSAFAIVGPYEAMLKPNAQYQSMKFTIPVLPNTPYTFSMDHELAQYVYAYELDSNKNDLSKGLVFFTTNSTAALGFTSKTATTKADTRFITLHFQNDHRIQESVIKNPMLTLGSKPKPFTPRNPSYLYAEAKLGAIGDKKDVLFKEDGKWKVRKQVVSNFSLETPVGWSLPNAPGDVVRVYAPNPPNVKSSIDTLLIKDNGQLCKIEDTTLGIPSTYMAHSNGNLYVNIIKSEAGWSNSYVHTSLDVKRYFNGWKYTNGTTWTSVTGNGQTATAQVALDTKPTDYTPYKLSYVLAAPVVEEVNVEGEIKVDGITQVEVSSGIIPREKAKPYYVSANKMYMINNKVFPTSNMSQKVKEFIEIYKNGKADKGNWLTNTNEGYGVYKAYIDETKFDPTAEYTVTYHVLDKPKLTNAPTSTKLTYANSIRASFQDLVTDVEDVSTQVSVDSKFLLDLMVQLKAMRG